MRKLLITILSVLLIIVAGCATTSEMTTETAAEPAPKSEPQKQKPEQDASEEKTAVIETVNTPYLVKETSYFSDGYVESYKVYSFNDDMSPAREDLFDSFDEIIESIVYEKVSDAEVNRMLFNARGELQSWKRIVSDEKGNPLLVESYNSEDVIQTSSEYTYGQDGEKKSWSVYDGDGVLLSETRYKYEGGNNTVIEMYDTSMEMKEYFENSYEDGLIVEQKHFDEDGKIIAAIEFSYTDGFLTEERHLRPNGSTSVLIKYTNDIFG